MGRTPKRLRGKAVAAALVPALSLAVLAGAPAIATGSGPVSQETAGTLSDVSCVSASHCYAVGYNQHGVGDVVAVSHGKPGKVTTVHGLQAINALSCVAGSGCVGIGRTGNDIGIAIVTISKAGKVSSKTLKIADGLELGSIDCRKLTSCVLAGQDTIDTPIAFVAATWNGHKLTIHKVKGAKGSDEADVAAIGCSGPDCVIVGYTEKSIHLTGFVLSVKNGKPGKLESLKNDDLLAAACASSTTCYIGGYNGSQGLVQTVVNGKVTKTADVTGEPMGLACHGQSCTAVGLQNPPSTAPPTATFYGQIDVFDAGVLKTTTPVAAANRYFGVAQPSAKSYVAVGEAADGVRSVITVP